jgi:hypothetical protein
MNKAPSKRANPYVRPTPISMRLTKRDTEIITRCFEDKILSSSNLQHLFFGTKQRCNRRLLKLYSMHYLDRHYFALPRPYCGATEARYSLGKQSVDVVALKKGMPREQVQRLSSKFARQIKSYSILFTLAHIQANAKARIAFEKALANSQSANIVNWIPERLLEQRFSDNDKTLKLRPDGFMQYQMIENGKTYNAFIETDMGTQGSRQIQDKVRRYLTFSETDLPEKRFGSQWFRVIFITTSERRSQSIKSAIEAVTDKVFWITDFDKLQGDWLDKDLFLRVGLSGRYPLL